MQAPVGACIGAGCGSCGDAGGGSGDVYKCKSHQSASSASGDVVLEGGTSGLAPDNRMLPGMLAFMYRPDDCFQALSLPSFMGSFEHPSSLLCSEGFKLQELLRDTQSKDSSNCSKSTSAAFRVGESQGLTMQDISQLAVWLRHQKSPCQQGSTSSKVQTAQSKVQAKPLPPHLLRVEV